MRQLQSLLVDLLVSAVEQIDINGSRNVLWMIAFAAQRFLDLNQLLKQTRGIAFIFKFNDRIQKFSGSRFATDRFSLVNRRGKNRTALHLRDRDIAFRAARKFSSRSPRFEPSATAVLILCTAIACSSAPGTATVHSPSTSCIE